MKKTYIGILAVSILALITGCATKGPKKIYAMPVAPTLKVKSPTSQAIADAPRTKPGSIMDPEALTYAQIPSRIIYLPGQHGLFGRSSAKQEVAYRLEPVDRIKAIQAQATPEFPETSRTDTTTTIKIKDITMQTFVNDDGTRVSGTARRLGILGQNDTEKIRALNLLRRGEELRWADEIGWVGFFAEEKAKAYSPKKEQQETIPPLDLDSSPQESTAEIEPIKEEETMEIITGRKETTKTTEQANQGEQPDLSLPTE